jgi:hypothetical protein
LIIEFYCSQPEVSWFNRKLYATSFSLDSYEWVWPCLFPITSGIIFSLYKDREVQRYIIDSGYGWSISLVYDIIYLYCSLDMGEVFHGLFYYQDLLGIEQSLYYYRKYRYGEM